MRERLAHQPEPRVLGKRAFAAKLGEHRRVIVGIDDHAHVRPILRRRPHHRGSADVDVLDRVVERASGLGDGLAERIEVDHDQVDERDRVLAQRGDVRRQVAAGEDARMDLRMQRLDAPVEHLRETRIRPDVGDRQPRIGKRARGAARRQERDAEGRESLREFDEAALVRDGQQGLLDGHAGRRVGAAIGILIARVPPA